MTQTDPGGDSVTSTFRRMAERFRGYLPVVVDVETGGFDWNRHALLELAAIPIEIDADGRLVLGEVACAHFATAPGTALDPQSLHAPGHVVRASVMDQCVSVSTSCVA